MSVRIDTTLQTYLAAVTIPGDFSGLPSNDFEVALGSYTTPGTFQAPDAVSINSTVSVTLTGRLGAGKSFDPVANTYYLWGRATRSPDETLTRGSTRITVVTDGGTPVGAAVHYVPQSATAPDPTVYEGWLDSSTVPPTLKGWNGTSWVAIGGGGSGGVTSFNTRTGAVTLSKADVTGTGLAAADVGADTAAARDSAIAALSLGTASTHAASDFATAAQGVKADSADQAGFVSADKTRLAATSGTNTGDQTLPTTLPPNGAAGGDLAGTYPNPTLAAAGTAGTYGDASHVPVFTTDAKGRVTAVTATSILIASGAVTGLGSLATQSGTFSGTSSGTNTGDETTATIKTKLGITTLSGSNTGDQTLPTTLPPNGAAGGDLSGTYPNPGVAKVNGTSLAGLATGLLKNTTTTGVPSIAAAADVPTVAAGATGPLSATDATTTNSRAPSGAAGGDLAGTYPNPTLGTAGTAGTYGDATHTVTLTTDAKGRVTAVTTNLITGSSFTRQLKTATYAASIGDYVAADTTGGAFTVTLPAASGGKGTVVLKWVAGSAAPSIAVTGSDHFDTSTGSTGGAFTLLNQAATYDSDGTSIWSVRNSFALSTLDTRYPLLSTVTTKGDLIVATASATVTRKAAGSNGTVLRARSGQSDGLGWSPEYLGPIRPFAVNEWRLNYAQNGGTGGLASGQMPLVLVPIPFDFTLDGLSFVLNSTATAGTCRMVLFSDNSGTPGTGVVDSGAISITTGAGWKTATGLAYTGTRGLYWAGLLAESITGSPTIVQADMTAAVTPWLTNPLGSGSTPSGGNISNDGYTAYASGISGSQVGATFTGSLQTDHSAPHRPICMWFRFSAVTL